MPSTPSIFLKGHRADLGTVKTKVTVGVFRLWLLHCVRMGSYYKPKWRGITDEEERLLLGGFTELKGMAMVFLLYVRNILKPRCST